MTSTRRGAGVLALAAASLLVVTGCGSAAGSESAGSGRISVVASTDVYAQIVEEVGGERLDVTSLIASTSQDPHSYEASARDQLTVSRADLIVENGGGYDPFVDALIEASGTAAPVITAVELSPEWPDAGETAETGDADPDEHDHDHVEGFNEHVWYDLATMTAVAAAIGEELAGLDPAGADTFRANAEAFATELADLTAALDDIAAESAGAKIFVTEPVPLYLTEAAGLDNVTPEAFSEAVEERQDVPPATLLESLDLLASGDVRVVIVNAQTGGAETTQVIEAATDAGIPVLEFTETLPEGSTYVQWMRENTAALAEALAT